MDIPNWLSLERVGRPDFRAATGLLVLEDFIRHNRNAVLPEGKAVTTSETNVDARIFSGFDWTAAFSGAVGLRTMNRGVGLFPYLDPEDSTLKFPILFADEGADTIQVDFSGATDPGTTDVWVRLVRTEATFGNRVFWNPSGAPAQESVSNVATRLVFGWEVTIQDSGLAAPGSDWVKVWEVTISGGNFTGSTDFRHSYFEGSLHSSDAQEQEWGDGANDRSTSRDLYPIGDWYDWVHMVRRQLADIIGSPVGAHTHFPVPAIELLQLANEHYAEVDGADRRGHHKDFQFGFPGRFIEMGTWNPAANNWAAEIKMVEETTDTPKMWFWLGEPIVGPERFGVIRIMPYGEQLDPQNVGDYSGISHWYDAITEYWTNDASNALTKRWKEGATTAMSLEVGSGAAAPGLHLPNDPIYAGDGFLLENSVDVYMRLPWSSMVKDTSGSRYWELDGPSDGDIGANIGGSISIKTIGAISGNKPLFFEFTDFPDGADLLAIDIVMAQSTTGAANEMRVYAARHSGSATTSDSHDAATDISLAHWTTQDLHSTQNYIQYVLNIQTTQVRRFKPNQNNTGWDRRFHKLVLGVVPPDTVDAVCYIIDIRMAWRYQNINPWSATPL